MSTNLNFTSGNKTLKWFATVWTIVIIAPLIYFPGADISTGHPWKVELFISFLLFATLACFWFIQKTNRNDFLLVSKNLTFVVIPFCAFIIWSGISAFWADSVLSVVHHTLIWACYLIFFLFALYFVSDNKLFKISIISLGSVISVICLCCICESTFSTTLNETFGFRYSRFAEIFAALLPLFFSFVLRLKRKHFVWAVSVTLFLWFGLIFSMSRGALLASVVGMSVFTLLRIFTRKTLIEKRRLIAALAGLVFVFGLTQISIFPSNEQKESTFSRMAIQSEKDPSNSLSRNIRLLFAGVGREMFFDNYFVGVGADNFGLEFNKYRAVFSANPQNRDFAGMQEEFLPERAHNEYLQIVTELGIVGAMIFLGLFCGIAKLAFREVSRNRFERGNILTHAAIAGIVAFLISSSFSSFSFRLMQNGLIFFFLLAILLRNYAVSGKQEVQSCWLIKPWLSPVLVLTALIACSSLTVFSAFKAASQLYVYAAETQNDFETSKFYYENAILLDPANASANCSFGIRLFGENKFQESALQLQRANEKGINTSVSYSYLISSQILANQIQPALKTNSEALEVFPYSVFLRIRYAALLKKYVSEEESEKQFRFAEQLNKKQAATWWLLVNNGALTLSEVSRSNENILTLEDMKPNQAVYAILAERQVVFPNEKPKFNFGTN